LSGDIYNELRQHPLPDRNDSDDQGPSDGVDYGVVKYHDFLSSLLHNPVEEASNDPIDDDPTDAPLSEMDDFRKKVKELHTSLYSDYKNYSRLSFIIELYLIKSRGKMSNVTLERRYIY